MPLPVIGASPNLGVTLGALAAIVTESEGRVDSMMVPIVTYNEFFGYEAQFHYYGFPSDNVRYNYTMSCG